jgi:heterotetrameric sarcosine oxidase delta subunit
MFVPCPFCGDREIAEFICRGEALPARPDASAADAVVLFHDYYYLRSNPAGETFEHWYHAAGCQKWLEVRRDTRTHRILGAAIAGSALS